LGLFLKEKTLFDSIVLYFLGKINMDLAFTPHFFWNVFRQMYEIFVVFRQIHGRISPGLPL
jgi:hypothetical protein